MKIFELHNNIPGVTVECLMIFPFKEIWERDKTKGKDVAFSEFQYIYFSADYKSLYLAFDKTTREERLIDDFIKIKGWKPDNLIINAIEVYKEFQNSPTMRFLQANQDAMESMSEYFSNIDWDEEVNGKAKYDITKVSTAVKNAGGIIDNIEKLKDKVAKEQSLGQDMARGGGSGGLKEFE
jgi:hypothetical protein